MKGRLLISVFLFSLGVLLLHACALIVPPTGGAKDIYPPKVTGYSPDSGAVNFSAKKINITFDEFVVLKDLQNQLIISPPMVHPPEVKSKKRLLTINLKDTLLPNTTYCFSFGKSIVDLNEGNTLEGFQYLMSTGPYLDSLVVSGKVYDAFTKAEQKGVLVMLYKNRSDSVIFKSTPDYFSKTKDDGSFIIGHIRPGAYKIKALKETNPNYLYNPQEESIGYVDSVVTLTNNTKVDVSIFKEIPTKQFIKKLQIQTFGHVRIAFNRPLDSLRILNLNHPAATTSGTSLAPPQTNSLEAMTTTYNPGRDTVDIWMPSFNADSMHWALFDGNLALDTINKAMPPKNDKTRKLKLTSNTPLSQIIELNQPLKINFSFPLNEIDTTKIKLIQGKSKVTGSYKIDNLNKQVLLVECPWTSDSTYKIILMPGAVTDIFQLTNDTIKSVCRAREERYYGTIKLNIKNLKAKDYVVQLVDDKETIYQQRSIRHDTTLFFNYLQPLSYKIKMIEDSNGDQKWTTGSYLKHVQPEQVFVFPGLINVRSNWDVEQEWDL